MEEKSNEKKSAWEDGRRVDGGKEYSNVSVGKTKTSHSQNSRKTHAPKEQKHSIEII